MVPNAPQVLTRSRYGTGAGTRYLEFLLASELTDCLDIQFYEHDASRKESLEME